MPSISDSPIDLLLDNLLPCIPVKDLLHLAQTSRFFADLVADDTLWKRKLQADFNFDGAGTARTSGWKFIYKGLLKPSVFLWGEWSGGRLGMDKRPNTTFGDVPFPVQLPPSFAPGARIVSLVAGGMCFHALDSEGRIYVWGTLDGSIGSLRSDGFSQPGKTASSPHRLELRTPTRSISCGRLHSTTMDARGQVWTFLSWGRPFRLASALLDCGTPETTPRQVECGWAFSSVLTQSGDVFAFWPFAGAMGLAVREQNSSMDQQGDDKHAHVQTTGIIPCVTWDLHMDPTRLPAIPDLPDLESTANIDTRLIQIAGLDNCLVGLTNRGHVLKYEHLQDETSVSQGRWEYLPKFSQVEIVKQHPTFVSREGYVAPEAPQRMQITHITANFRHFVAYSTGSSSIVLMGDIKTTPDTDPSIIPELQNRDVISVAIGDYHYAALTLTGKVLTWGQYSKGALGLGDPVDIEIGKPGGMASEEQRAFSRTHRMGAPPPPVKVPTEVRFDHTRRRAGGGEDKFCFAVTAAGWHTGALVIDLEPGEENQGEAAAEDDDDPSRRLPGHFPPDQPPFPSFDPGEAPGYPLAGGRGLGVFRIGFAGRAAYRGRGFGGGRGI